MRDSIIGYDHYPSFYYFLLINAYYMVHTITTNDPWLKNATRYSILKPTECVISQNILGMNGNFARQSYKNWKDLFFFSKF